MKRQFEESEPNLITQKCRCCKAELKVESFYFKKNGCPLVTCIKCFNKERNAAKERNEKKKETAALYIKLKPCTRCDKYFEPEYPKQSKICPKCRYDVNVKRTWCKFWKSKSILNESHELNTSTITVSEPGGDWKMLTYDILAYNIFPNFLPNDMHVLRLTCHYFHQLVHKYAFTNQICFFSIFVFSFSGHHQSHLDFLRDDYTKDARIEFEFKTSRNTTKEKMILNTLSYHDPTKLKIIGLLKRVFLDLRKDCDIYFMPFVPRSGVYGVYGEQSVPDMLKLKQKVKVLKNYTTFKYELLEHTERQAGVYEIIFFLQEIPEYEQIIYYWLDKSLEKQFYSIWGQPKLVV